MSAPINDGGPAFPAEEDTAYPSAVVTTKYQGMTLRDYFAASALQGICASSPGNHLTDQHLAREAYNLADAMIKARSS